MATQVQFRRGNTANMSTFTGAAGEITVDTDKKVVVVHDGTTAGGVAGVSASQLSSNLSSYQTTAGLAGNVAILTANNANNLGGTAAASYQLNSTLNANIASYLPTYTGVVNGSSITVGSSTISNSTGVYTGIVNGSSITVGSSFVANSTGAYHTGAVNAASHTVGTSFTANSTVVNAVSFYAGTTLIGNTTGPYGKTEGNLNVNSALTSNNSSYLGGTIASGYQTTAGLSANIASYLPTYTGVVNGSSITVSSSFVANSTGVYDSKGEVRTVIINNQTIGYTLVANDAGKCISITTGGVTVPNSVFSNGQTIVIYNNSSANQTITQGTGVTMYQVGTSTTGNRTLAQRGLATVLCVVSGATPTFVISGGGLT